MNFERKHFLLDTNFLIDSSKAGDRLGLFFDFVKEHNGAMFIIDASYFEFLRYASTTGQFQDLDHFVRRFPIIETREEDVRRATLLSVLCHNKRPDLKKQISYTDALLGSQVLKFKEKLVLVTTDIYDFPDCIFDRVKVWAIDLGERVVTLGFLAYSAEKYDQCLIDFQKTAR